MAGLGGLHRAATFFCFHHLHWRHIIKSPDLGNEMAVTPEAQSYRDVFQRGSLTQQVAGSDHSLLSEPVFRTDAECIEKHAFQMSGRNPKSFGHFSYFVSTPECKLDHIDRLLHTSTRVVHYTSIFCNYHFKSLEGGLYHDGRELSGNQKQYRKCDLSAENFRNLDFYDCDEALFIIFRLPCDERP